MWNPYFNISFSKNWCVTINLLHLQCPFWMLKVLWGRWPMVSNELWVVAGGRDTYIQRRFLNALGLTLWESRKFKLVVKKKQSNGNAPWGVIIVPISLVGYDIYIGVGLSALLGQTDRAMRESQHVGPGTELAPRLSQNYILLLLIINTLQVAAWCADTIMFPNYNTSGNWCLRGFNEAFYHGTAICSC